MIRVPATAARRVRWTISTACVALLLGTSHAALGADLSREVLDAPDATVYTSAINSYILAKYKGLSSTDASEVKSAREGLVGEMRGITPPSASFADVYCGDLATVLTSLTSNPDPRIRLNVAIVTARVAERAQDASARLSPLVMAELKDTNAGVVLWAMRAARETIVPTLNVNLKGVNNPLVLQILAAAKATTNGAVIGAAYDALSADSSNPTSLPVYISATQQLLTFRLSQYSAGTTPTEPAMDSRGTGFLADRKVWTSQAKVQQLATIKLIVDLVSAANTAYGPAQGTDKDELATLLGSLGKALYVIALNNQDAPLQTGVTALAGVTPRSSAAAIAAAIAQAYAATTVSFPTVKPAISPATKPMTPPPAAVK